MNTKVLRYIRAALVQHQGTAGQTMIEKDGVVTSIDLSETTNDQEVEVTFRLEDDDDLCIVVSRTTLTQISDLLAAFLRTVPCRVLH